MTSPPKLLAIQALTFLPVVAFGGIVINEVHYDAEPKTEFVEFIELFNSGSNPVDLEGWSFTNGVSIVFPADTTLAASGYLLLAENPVALAAKFPGIPANTQIFPYTGTLSNDGETLTLSDSIGTVMDMVTYRTEFPWPIAPNGEGDAMQLINPALENDLGGAWRAGLPTPGLQNTVFAINAPPIIRQISHTPETPNSSTATTVSARITDLDVVASVSLLYQIVTPGNFIPAYLPNAYGTLTSNPDAAQQPNPDFENPSNWTTVAMVDDGSGTYAALIPAQLNRTLVRYRIVAEDTLSKSVLVPYADDDSLNFAFFVYDGVPDYVAGSVTFDSAMLTALPVYTMITRDADRKYAYAYSNTGDSGFQIPKGSNARNTYNWECALVYDGIVYDHVGWRLRQNNDRYAGNGKRSMRFRLNRGRYFQARGEDGKNLPVKWRRFNTSKMSRFGGTNSFGFHETINSKLWRMVGVECPYFLPAHFRMIDAVAEAPDQYNGDFFGLATIVQDIDGQLLDERSLPNGNIYKLKDGFTNPLELQRNQSRIAVDDGSDFTNIKNNLNASQSDAWLRDHVRWDQWTRYHAVVEAVRHYDFGTPSTHFKNRAWYFQEQAGTPHGLLRIIPHDHDASWLKGYHDTLNSTGNSIGTDFPWAAIFGGNTRPPSGGNPAFTIDYRNFIREFRDLLWREETVNTLIDDHIALLRDFSLADAARWTGGPAAAGSETMSAIETIAAPMKDFAFVSDTVYNTNLAGGRGAFLDQVAAELAIPNTPAITYSGVAGFPAGGLIFTTSAFSDPQGAGTFGKMEWRIAEVAGLGGNGDDISLASSGDTWKYFEAGTDPGARWTQMDHDDNAWGAGATQIGYGEADQITTVRGGNATTYFRRKIQISDPGLYGSYAAGIIRDDGAIVYVNGVEVWRNQMPAGTVNFTTEASISATGSNESDFQTFTIPANLFIPGDNIFAVEVHQKPAASADMSFDFQLSATPLLPERKFEWKANWESGEMNPFQNTIQAPAVATRAGSAYRARVRHADTSGHWSHWSAPLEFTASAPDISPYTGSLVISEIMYHPADPTSAEIAVGFDNDDYFEFIEIRNTGTQALDLSNVRFTKGIDFDFSGILGAGETLIVVNNIAAFSMRYGGLPVAGAWTGKLDNGGEQIKLSFGAGEAISDFLYDDIAPWPTSPDGSGASLTRILTSPANDPNSPASWRPSVAVGGSPGATDVVLFTGDPGADTDGDGIPALLEHAFGTLDTAPDSIARLFSFARPAGVLTISLQHNLAADDIVWMIERSENLTSWTPAEGEWVFAGSTDNGDGTETRHFINTEESTTNRFWRMRASLSNP